MVLISKFHDYYDPIIQQVGRDASVVFDRRQSEPVPMFGFEFPHHNHATMTEKGDRIECSLGAVILSGCMHPYVRAHTDFHWQQSKPSTDDYSYEQSAIKELLTPHVEPKYMRRWRARGYSSKNMQMLLDAAARDYTELNRKYNTPVLHLYWDRGLLLATNPCLFTLQFQRVLGPFDAYQSVYGFLSGVMTRPDTLPRPTTDKAKAVAHGFDAKTSFRADAHPRKPRGSRK